MQLQCGNSKYNGALKNLQPTILPLYRYIIILLWANARTFNAFSMNNIVTQGKINVKGYPEFLSNINQIQGHLEHV